MPSLHLPAYQETEVVPHQIYSAPHEGLCRKVSIHYLPMEHHCTSSVSETRNFELDHKSLEEVLFYSSNDASEQGFRGMQTLLTPTLRCRHVAKGEELREVKKLSGLSFEVFSR
jgi:hypothetical protein